jgi:hypothetical protein
MDQRIEEAKTKLQEKQQEYEELMRWI